LEGSVGESYDLLYSTDLNSTGEIYHRIEHCLIGNGKIEEIDTVYSHPQALGQ
jgi:Prephenate dehydratase